MAGTTLVSFDKPNRRLTFAYSAPHSHTKWVFNLWNESLNANWADNCSIEGAIKGTGTGWSGACYVGPGPSGVATFTGVDPNTINADMQFSIRIAFPDEGGGAGGEAHVSGAEILSLPDPSGSETSVPATSTVSPTATQTSASPAPASSPGPVAPSGTGGANWFTQSTVGIPNWALALGGTVIAARML